VDAESGRLADSLSCTANGLHCKVRGREWKAMDANLSVLTVDIQQSERPNHERKLKHVMDFVWTYSMVSCMK
jgi:hypothetical protein